MVCDFVPGVMHDLVDFLEGIDLHISGAVLKLGQNALG
jgi:hypothetical protein